ncbi:hypothetical protein CDD81_2066 [Ophiocordyceps australis]|uniref:Uncharacterized protein n=1 Tax=Ophiocordyceps australis TaxID=1399860 RepID=A0A2C5XEY5_9HYPO|nr:hypothetical protein CDD81_2066 [Ophiocordyceps australis]
MYTWTPGSEPPDLDSDTPDTSTWGTPSFWLGKGSCDLDRVFLPQKLIINLNLCGTLAYGEFWTNTQCNTITNYTECKDWVAKNPKEFAETYFQIKDIRIFKESETRTSSSVSMSTAVATSALSTGMETSSALASSMLSSASRETLAPTSSVALNTSAMSLAPSTSVKTLAPTSSVALNTSVKTLAPASSLVLSTSVNSSGNGAAPTTTLALISSSSTSHASLEAFATNSTTSKPASIVPTLNIKLSSSSANTTMPSSSSSSLHALGTPNTIMAAPTSSLPRASMSMRLASASSRSSSATLTPTRSWSDSSVTTAGAVAVETVTVYTTWLSTITSCPPSVTACPSGKVEQTVIPWYTTGVQVEPKQLALEQTIVYVYTITKCPVTVTNCPLGQVGTLTRCAGPECQASTTAAPVPTNGVVAGNPAANDAAPEPETITTEITSRS